MDIFKKEISTFVQTHSYHFIFAFQLKKYVYPERQFQKTNYNTNSRLF